MAITLTQLYQVPLQALSGGGQLHPQAAAAFEQLRAAAAQQGLQLTALSAYRSLERQCQIWNAKWLGQRPVLDANNQPLTRAQFNDAQWCAAICRFSAIPGFSRHHLGSDVDVWDPQLQQGATLQLIDSEYLSGAQHPLFVWLSQHAHQYGFHFPYADHHSAVAIEPWHLSYLPLAQQQLASLTPQLIADYLQQQPFFGSEQVLAQLPHYWQYFITQISPAGAVPGY